MRFLVVTPPSIYHGCSTWKTFWEENFTGKKQYLFEPVNMRKCGKCNFRKHREIKDSDERVTLKAYENMYEILKFSEKFDNLDKMETTSSESKVKMEVPGKWLVTALDLKTKAYDCQQYYYEVPSCYSTVYLSWLLHSEDVLGGKFYR